MTLEQIKEALSTYGVNDDERNAPVRVIIDGTEYPITEAEVDWTPDGGNTVLLQAEGPMTCDKCRAKITDLKELRSGAQHLRGCPRYDCGCDWDSRARNPKGCEHGGMSLRQLAAHPHTCGGQCASLVGGYR